MIAFIFVALALAIAAWYTGWAEERRHQKPTHDTTTSPELCNAFHRTCTDLGITDAQYAGSTISLSPYAVFVRRPGRSEIWRFRRFPNGVLELIGIES